MYICTCRKRTGKANRPDANRSPASRAQDVTVTACPGHSCPVCITYNEPSASAGKREGRPAHGRGSALRRPGNRDTGT